MDCHLNWKQHILNISKKISRSIGVMYKLRHYINLSMLVNIYYSLIYPHLIYAVQVWGSACKTELNKLLVLQKKAVRMMTFNDQIPQIPGPLYNSNPLFYVLKILKIDDIFMYVNSFIPALIILLHIYFMIGIKLILDFIIITPLLTLL